MDPIREDIDNFLDMHEAGHTSVSVDQQVEDIQLPDDFDYSLLQDLQEFPDPAPDLIPENIDNIRPTNDSNESAEAFQGQATFDDLNPDYYQFYMPHYYRPEKPCQYCASHRLECKMFRTGDNKGCNTCTYLFRTCSFVEQQDDLGPGRIDLLHPVNEDVAEDNGQLTRIESLYTAGASATEIAHNYERGRKRQEKTGRFNREVLHVLRSWLQAHADHPYPTEEEKAELSNQTGLTKVQVSNWLANARRRGKVLPKRGQSPSATAASRSSAAIPIAARARSNSTSADQSHMTPFDRWKESPPEHEAPITLIKKNAAETSIQTFASSSSVSLSHELDLNSSRSSTLSTRQNRPGSSVTSLENPVSSDSRSQGSGSLISHASSRSHSSYNSFARKERRRRHRLSAKQATTAKKPSRKSDTHRPFQCTFCVDTFYTKHDWTRHEKSMHLNLEKWVCAPHGELQHDAAGAPYCAYCGLAEPSREHLDAHDHAACVARGANSRTFLRKDHLKQHLRLVHTASMPAHADKWRMAPPVVRSRCGFCDAQFTTWEERAAHLAGHFRAGTTMAGWRGTWGFEPEVAACVADAMPPFLIDGERAKPLPWSVEAGATHMYDGLVSSATDSDNNVASGSTGADAQLVSDARGWEVVTALLAAYVRECAGRGERITDEMLQRRARVACYASDDAWNQTRADDAQWLALFKQQVGLREDGTHTGTNSVTSPANSNFGSSTVSLGADLGIKGPAAARVGLSPNTAGTSPSIGFGDAPAPADMWDPAKYLEAQDPAAFDEMDLLWQMDDA